MEYTFEITINTDGDFYFPYMPCDMEYYPASGQYSLNKTYDDKTEAIKDITRICAFLKEQMDTGKDWAKEEFNECVDSFVRQVCGDNSSTYITKYMSGNYDGTEFTFNVIPNMYSFSLALTDEEWELIRKNKKLVSLGQVKDAVLALFKE